MVRLGRLMSREQNDYSWIATLDPKVQLEVFRRLTPYLSSQDLMQVMKRVQAGKSIFEAHRDLGLISRYYVHLLRILESVDDG